MTSTQTTKRFTKATARIVAGIAIVATAGITATGVAAADDEQDALYLKVIAKQGITFPSDSQAIRLAHTICSQLDDGTSFKEIVQDGRDNSELSDYDIGFVIGASVNVYCPSHKSDLPS